MHPDNRLNESSVKRSATEARQAVTSHNVRYVLFFSILGTVIGFALAFAWWS